MDDRSDVEAAGESSGAVAGPTLSVAIGFSLVGAVVMLLAGVVAVAHFAFDVPIRERHTGLPASDAQIGNVLFAIGATGALFLALGIFLNKQTEGGR